MGSRLHLNVQLIDTESGEPIWADRYDGGVEDLFELQDELCMATLVETDAALSQGDPVRAQRELVNSDEAFRHLQQAITSWARLDPKGIDRAEREVDLALRLDPDLTHASMFGVTARAHRVLLGWAGEPERSLAEAMAICEDAMARVPAGGFFGGLHMLRGLIHPTHHEFGDAVRQCETGIVLVVAAPAFHIHARCLIAVGEIDRAY